MIMIVVIIITTVVFLLLFGLAYWLADKVDKEQEAIRQYNEWLKEQEQYQQQNMWEQGQYGNGSWF